MKDTKDMNLEELADKVFNLEYCVNGCVKEISGRLREIHEQTRWIDVEERRPVFSDCNGLGGVETLYANVTGFAQIDENGTIWAESLISIDQPEAEIKEYRPNDYFLPFSHWRQIILPWDDAPD